MVLSCRVLRKMSAGFGWITAIFVVGAICFFSAPSASADEQKPGSPILSAPVSSSSYSSDLPQGPAPEQPAAGSGSASDISKIKLQNGAENQSAGLQGIMDRIQKMPPPVRKQLEDEAAYAKDYCTNNPTLGNFYDCSCFSLKLIGERIDRGPDVPFINLIGDVKFKECVAEPSIAGYAYNRCNDTLNLTQVTTEKLKTICECVGRTMPASYATQPVPEIRYIDRLFLQILTGCRQKNGL